MQLMLVYRFLRKISDWTTAGFYSEVYVAGQEYVPQDGPIILAATHHNEIIDIAVLSVTIPHRRRICYWAKSTLFKNPFSGALLRSSGSIPVQRNPNNVGNQSGSLSSASSHAELFKHTSVALARGEVVGVFPEGTSYTEPAIAQVKEGAAWAAIEYVKAVAARATGGAERNLMIVPAAIVYTDKSRYQSRVLGFLARYGKPIHVDDFLVEVNLEDDDSVRAAVRDITGEIYRRLKEMTINALDWDTRNSAKIATEVAWGENLSISKYVGVSQTFVELLSGEGQEILDMKQSLVKYLGLLHYSGISHATLDYLYPLPVANPSSSSMTVPNLWIATLTVLCQLCKTFLHPSAIAFLPVFVLHLPVYVSGWLAARFLTKPDEEEAKAQFKAIFGGLGMGLSYGMVIRIVLKTIMHVGGKDGIGILPPFFIVAIGILRERLLNKEGMVRKLIGMVAVTVGTVRILWKWHNSLVRGNLKRWKRLSASVKVLVGIISNGLSEARVVAYSRPPPPAENPFIKRAAVDESAKIIKPPPASAAKLIRPLLAARLDAIDAVRKLEIVGKARGRGAGWERDKQRELPNKEGD